MTRKRKLCIFRRNLIRVWWKNNIERYSLSSDEEYNGKSLASDKNSSDLESRGGRLGHSDSFCHSKMELRFEAVEIGWNLSLQAQSRRALAMNSVWLHGDGDEIQRGSSIK
ncbi:hypothetical protein J1N35_007214 [Gossypium stocksii]|uniref:Uncharacterized protein n=1 Tax=Gossypium stocksii TaxID=47602 RepID=A0A9D4AFD6_9ROSI|nr:hypothetical protein J1N35_007214 [Gossypium stocksii]